MKIGLVIGMFAFSLFQHGCGKTDVKNQSFTNNENLANVSISPTPPPIENIPPGQETETIEQIIAHTPPDLLARAQCEPVEEVNLTIPRSQAPVRVKFDARGSTAPCGKIISYSWDFGDGTSGRGIRTSHTYTKQGNYEASVFLKDNKGHTTLIRPMYGIEVTNNYSISGQITDVSGDGVSDVTVNLIGGQGISVQTQTNAAGKYSFPKIISGNWYEVTPVKTGLHFKPANKTFNSLSISQIANFEVQ